MRAIMNRLRRLEDATAPVEWERAIVEAILTARRRRLGASCEPLSFPIESYAGCSIVAQHLLPPVREINAHLGNRRSDPARAGGATSALRGSPEARRRPR
jgi:hypothetical protein